MPINNPATAVAKFVFNNPQDAFYGLKIDPFQPKPSSNPFSGSQELLAHLQSLATQLPTSVELPAIPPVAPGILQQGFTPVSGPTPDFWQTLLAQRLNPVSQEFFGPGGVAGQALGNLEERGLLVGGPQGAAAQFFGQTVSEPFARARADVANQVAAMGMEAEQRVKELNAQRFDEFQRFTTDLQQRDIGNAQERAATQVRLNTELFKLQADIQDAMLGRKTAQEMAELDKEMAELDNRTRLFEISMQHQEQQAEISMQRQEQQAATDAQRGQLFLQALQVPGAMDTFPFQQFGLPLPLPPPMEDFGRPKIAPNVDPYGSGLPAPLELGQTGTALKFGGPGQKFVAVQTPQGLIWQPTTG